MIQATELPQDARRQASTVKIEASDSPGFHDRAAEEFRRSAGDDARDEGKVLRPITSSGDLTNHMLLSVSAV